MIRSTANLVARGNETLVRAAGSGRRYMLGIAGIPGAGKSPFAEKIRRELNALEPRTAAVVPLDGFHLTGAELERCGLSGRKGAPETFDTGAFVSLLRRAR